MQAFDLDNYTPLASEEGAWMPLMDPVTELPILGKDEDGNEQPVRIKLLGMDAPTIKAKEREFMNRRLMKNKVRVGSAEQLEGEAIEMLVACTQSWEGFTRSGAVWPCTPANARELYSKPEWAFIREQVNRFIGERANFLQPSKMS